MASDLLDGGDARLRLTPDVYIPASQEDGLGRLEATLKKVVRARPARQKVRTAARDGGLDGAFEDAQTEDALTKGIITKEEYAQLVEAMTARLEAIKVDDFDPETYRTLKG